MCGILAILGIPEGAAAKTETAMKCLERQNHRGPDYTGSYVKGKNFLGHKRLAIIDPATGSQPLYNEKKSVVVIVNGEIYNHRQLRHELRAENKHYTESDSEIILPLYETYGEKFISKLRGVFAFVLYDEEKNFFMAARDAIGVVPLYMGWGKDGSIWFSSELKGLIDQVERFIDFPPGHVFTSLDKAPRPWYAPEWYDEKLIPSQPVDLKILREKMEQAVIRRLMSDVPYGVLLSGGLDSSIVSAIVSRHCQRRMEDDFQSEAWYPRLHTFSIGLKDAPDLLAARRVAKFLKSVHHELNFTVEEGQQAISSVIHHLETFDVTTIRAATPMFLMSRKIKMMGIKMILSGEGSDEIFGGYLYFHKAPNKEEFHVETIRKLKLLHKYDCLRANKATAAWGLEVRVPFLDTDFVEYAMSIDPKDKMITKEKPMEKWILRKAFEGYLPDDILWRQKEQFSDGVGYSWIDSLKAVAAKSVSDEEFAKAKERFPDGTPATKEAYYYRTVFEKHFPHPSAIACIPGGPSVACSTPAAILWDASFKHNSDPSGRAVLGVHTNANAVPDKSNGVHANGNGVHANGNGVHANGNSVPMSSF